MEKMDSSSDYSDFTNSWVMYKGVLGEGAFGEVRLLINKYTKDKIACKIIDHTTHKDAKVCVQKEVMIHKMFNHENIIRYFGRRHEPTKEYIFLEYADGGELFQRIEPGVGMSASDAQYYLRNLLCGLDHIHEKGVTHRDIKPENLLIGSQGVLKISDFGLATVFRLRGKERILEKKCGTRPYMAPEVFRPNAKYKAKPADLWACGIVFVCMLTGELPWSEPEPGEEEFDKWCNGDYLYATPWSKLGNTALSLAKQMLHIDYRHRLTSEQVLKHPWMRFDFGDDPDHTVTNNSRPQPGFRFNSMRLMETESKHRREAPQITLSQPAMAIRPTCIDQLVNEIKVTKKTDCFSQPTKNDDVILPFTPSLAGNFPNLFRRMTRFYVNCSMEEALGCLGSVLDGLHYSWTLDVSGTVIISTVDSRKNPLVFKTNFLEMDGKIMADFRLSKGCGLEFKKKFVRLRSCLANILLEFEPTTPNGNEPKPTTPKPKEPQPTTSKRKEIRPFTIDTTSTSSPSY